MTHNWFTFWLGTAAMFSAATLDIFCTWKHKGFVMFFLGAVYGVARWKWWGH